MKKRFIIKITAVLSVIALAVSMAVLGFAAKTAEVYLAVSENKSTGSKYADVYLFTGKSVSDAEISLSASGSVSVAGCFGSIMPPVSGKASHTDNSARLTLSLDDGYNTDELAYAGRIAFKTDSSFSGKIEDTFSLLEYTADGEKAKCDLKIVDANEFDPDSFKIAGDDENTEKKTTLPSGENESTTARVTEPASITEPADVSEPVSGTDKPVEPEKVISANVGFYVYSDFNNNVYAAVELNLGNVKSMIVSVSADKSKFTLGEEAVMFSADRVNSNVVIDSESNSVIITAMTSEKYVDSYVAYIPLTLNSGVSVYDDFSSSFVVDSAIINGRRANVTVHTLSSTYTPEKYGENWFKGFDATFNRYGDGENLKEEYLFYTAGAGFANDYYMELTFKPDVKIVRASAVDESGTCEISTDSDGQTKVILRVNSAEEKKLDYRSVVSVIVKTDDEKITYKNIWDYVSVSKFTTNSIEQKTDGLKFVSYLGNWEHYDTVDGVHYVSYDFGEKKGYSAVMSYEASTENKDVVIRDCVREGYTVAQINKYALKNCLAKSITLPDTIEIILEGAFSGCKNIKEFTLTPAVYAVKERAFEGCSNLEKVVYNNSLALEEIGAFAFLDCKEYKTIELPAGKYALGEYSYGFINNSNGSLVKNDGVKFICVSGSPAKDYAIDNGFDYECIGEAKFDIITGAKARMLCNFADGYVIIDAGKTLGDIEDMFKSVNAKSLMNSDNKKVSDENTAVVTGMKLALEGKDKYLDIAVRGDTDSNGAVSASDARIVLRIASRLETNERVRDFAADVDYNDSVTAKDARMILRAAAKIENL
ncbi:MAG: leucine-rich repeat protein [Oscillospiraceae bacterium]|nr:leucine-rich repeat protein [Oscillospiraceae bacterium]